MLAITGNIAEGTAADDHDGGSAGGVKLHIHIVLGCGDASVRGGHLVAGRVSPTMELIIEEDTALQAGLGRHRPRWQPPRPDALDVHHRVLIGVDPARRSGSRDLQRPRSAIRGRRMRSGAARSRRGWRRG